MNEYFFEYMRGLLGERYDAFYKAYTEKPRHKALRVNTNKITVDRFKSMFGGELKQNPLCHNSFYCNVKPSLDPLYHAGLYYMQEPSASAAVAAFAPFIGERVLDLCAAPGGKSTQAAEYMNGGVLFCNDSEYKRTKALAENIERLGIDNAVITCGTASDYVKAGFTEYFDTLIVDAPCSGGGMMRYEEVPYSENIVKGCAERQRAILADAVKLLQGGGYMLYSTCTFAKEENEDNINYLRLLGMRTVDIPLLSGTERGIDMPDARRIYPIDFDGEGHFFCVLQKTSGGKNELPPLRKKRGMVKFGDLKLNVSEIVGKRTILDLDNLDIPDLLGLNVICVGTPVFDDGAPSHALTHALDGASAEKFGTVELGEYARDYIAGEQIQLDAPSGNLIATVNGYALGLVKSAAGGDGVRALKNKYPKCLRVHNS
ncbi:MAG: hypothetical protein K2K13_05390 [Clostridiales bacterium]|nr:hypothetical protein [Clostridiales bacterium]